MPEESSVTGPEKILRFAQNDIEEFPVGADDSVRPKRPDSRKGWYVTDGHVFLFLHKKTWKKKAHVCGCRKMQPQGPG